jgi:hypothetical protein
MSLLPKRPKKKKGKKKFVAARINSGVCDAPLPLKKHAWPRLPLATDVALHGAGRRQEHAALAKPHAVRAGRTADDEPFWLGWVIAYYVPVKDTAATENTRVGILRRKDSRLVTAAVQTVTAYVYLQFGIALGGWVAKTSDLTSGPRAPP